MLNISLGTDGKNVKMIVLNILRVGETPIQICLEEIES